MITMALKIFELPQTRNAGEIFRCDYWFLKSRIYFSACLFTCFFQCCCVLERTRVLCTWRVMIGLADMHSFPFMGRLRPKPIFIVSWADSQGQSAMAYVKSEWPKLSCDLLAACFLYMSSPIDRVLFFRIMLLIII